MSDNLVLRQFCRLCFKSVPDDTTTICWAKEIRPETLADFHVQLLQLATQLKVTRGYKLRTM
jgi:hypothetical protein